MALCTVGATAQQVSPVFEARQTGAGVNGVMGGDDIPDLIVSPGRGAGSSHIIDGATLADLGGGFPFGAAFGGGVRVALGDLTGDGIDDIVTAMGQGGGLVKVLNGVDASDLGGGLPFGPGFSGGVNVALGDFNGDGRLDVVTAQATGGGVVSVFDGVTYAPIFSLQPFGGSYVRGLNLATGDVNADGVSDIVVGQGSGGIVSVIDGSRRAVALSGVPFGAGGVFVAAGDVNGDGRADVMAAPDSGPGPVLVYDVNALAPLTTFVPYGPGYTGGVRLAASDLDGDGRVEIITAPGPGGPPVLKVFDGATFENTSSVMVYPEGFGGGVFVAAPSANNIKFTSASSTTFTVGTADTFTVRVKGSATISQTGTLPAGISFASNPNGTATLSGTPATGTGGTYPLTFTASSGSGAPVVQSFTLAVNQAPAITSAASATFAVGVASTFTVTSTGFPRATVTVTGTLPAGITFTRDATGGGTLAGTAAVGTSGTYPLTVSASNGVGTTATQSFVLTITSAPAFTSAPSVTFSIGTAATFSVTTSALPAVTSITRTGTLPTGITFTDNGNGTATLSGTAAVGTAGAYPLTFTASNGTSSAQQLFTLTVQASSQAPTITSANATTFTVGGSGSFSVTTTGSPTPTLVLTGALPSGVTFTNNGNGTATLAGTPAAGTGGIYALSINASNGVGTAAVQGFTLTVNQAPAITSANATTFTVGANGSFTVTSTGSPAATLSLTGALPSGVTFTNNGNGTGTLAGTPAAGTGGSYPVTLAANNGVGTASTQNFVLTVTSGPAFTSAASATFVVGTAATFNITTSAAPAVTSITRTGALPSGVTFTYNNNGTATLAGTPAAGSGGVYALTFTASNGTPVQQAFTLTVNQAPAITSANNTTFTRNVAGSFSITATGVPVPTVTVTGTLPAGVTFTPSAGGGTLSGTTTATAGPYVVTIGAANGVGAPAAQSFTLTVAAGGGGGPVGTNDTYSNGVGNTQYSVGAGTPATPAVVVSGSVLANDTGAAPLSAGPAIIASTSGGQVAMSSNGSFIYTPAAGFAGPSDTFTYTVTDGNAATGTAVVTINLTGVVWYVNAGAGGGGSGRSNSPFNTMTAAATAAQANQIIYVHAGSPAGATLLKASQTLWGAGAAYTLNGLTIPAASAPTLQSTITLANGVLVNSLSVNGGAAPAVVASSLTGTETLNAVAITGGATGLQLSAVGGTVTVTGGSIAGVTAGADVLIAGGTGTVNIGAAINNTGGRSIDIQNRTAGTVSFSGAISDTGTGILLNANTGSTINFTGGLALATSDFAAFTATGGGVVTATQNNTTIVNTILTDAGTALHVANTDIGPAGLTFRSISAGNNSFTPGVGIVLDHTGVAVSNGGLTVTGTGAAASGGRIWKKSGADGSTTAGVGIYLNTTKNPSFNWMDLYLFDNFGIVGREVYGFLLADSIVEEAGTTAGLNEGPLVFGVPGPSGVNGLIGAGTLRNAVIKAGVEHNAAFYNLSGSMTLAVQNTTGLPGGCHIGSNSGTTGQGGLVLQLQGAAVGSVDVQQCLFRGNRSQAVLATASNTANLTLVVNASDIAFTGQGMDGIVLSNTGDASVTGTITGNTFYSLQGSGVRLGQAAGAASASSMLRATITGNTFDSNTSAGPGIAAALSSTLGQAAPARIRLASNTVTQYTQQPGISITTPNAGTSPVVDVTIENNHVDMMEVPGLPAGTRGSAGIAISSTQSAANVCANVLGNSSHWKPVSVGAGGGILASQSGGATFRLERGSETLLTAAATVLSTNNSTGFFGPSTTSVAGTLSVVENGACQVP